MRKDPKIYNILIIEDNLGDYVLIEEYLTETILNPVLAHCKTFQEAQRTLQNSDHFDIIFLDLSLPDLSGEKLIVDVINLAENIPVIALTGFSDLEFSIRSLSLGISDYLLKDELTATILYKSIIYAIERNKYIEELHDSEKRYSDLFHLSPSPMWVYDLETLKFLDVNKAAQVKYGYSEEEFLSMTIRDIRPEEEIAKLEQALKEKWEEDKILFKRVFRHRIKSGKTIEVEIESSKILVNDRDAALVLANDITDKVEYISTIEKQNQTLREIAWIQSHVVRAPLARLMGLINLLEFEGQQIDPEKEELLNYIKNSADELDEIIRDISKKSENISPLKNGAS